MSSFVPVTCACHHFDVRCANRATQEDLLCDDCRWFKHNSLGPLPRPQHGVTTSSGNVRFTESPHYNTEHPLARRRTS